MSETTKTGSQASWIPLESNPEVFNSWAKKAGLVISQAHFEDIYGLDDDLLAIVPQPVKAVVLLFPIDDDGEAKRKEEDEKIAREGQPQIDNTVFWIKQTISNACGTIGLIHALANSDVTYTPMSALQDFIFKCQDKTPLERAKLLETTRIFSEIHAESADSGQSAAVSETDLHFTCFIEAPDADIRGAAQGVTVAATATDKKSSGMRLIELDGRREGPIDHGECKDLLKDVANLVKARYMTGSKSVLFSLMALSTAPREEEEEED